MAQTYRNINNNSNATQANKEKLTKLRTITFF